jgi:anti-sigma B factor antagonist
MRQTVRAQPDRAGTGDAVVAVRVTSEDVGERSVVAVSGEIDVASADAMRERLNQLVSAGRTSLVVDLTAVQFMDSTGLGVLVGTLKKVRGAGGSLDLVIDGDRLLRLFRLTSLDQVFTIHATLEDALG